MDNKPTILFAVPPGPTKLYRGMICTFVSKANYIWQPFDFITLSAHIPENYSIKLLDCNIEKLNFDEAVSKVKQIQPSCTVISISSIALENDLRFVGMLREVCKGSRIIVFGDVLLERSYWAKVQDCGVDLILDPMDVDFGNYIETGRSSSGNIILSQNRSPVPREEAGKKPKKVSIGIPRHKHFVKRRYRMPFIKSFVYTSVCTQFSCPFRCHYCSCAKLPVTYRGYEEIIEELDSIRELGIREIYFGDPSFGFPKENTVALLDAMIKKNYNFRWFAYFNPVISDENILRRMKKTGCHTLIIGVEDENIDMLNARFERTLSREKLLEFVGDCKKIGIKVCGDFIIGINKEKGAIDKSVDFAIKLDLDFASFNIYAPLMGSIIREEMIEEGKIAPDSIGYDTAGTTGKADKSLVELRNRAVRRFYLRPSYLYKRITGLTSVEELCIQCAEMIGLFKNTLTGKKRYAE